MQSFDCLTYNRTDRLHVVCGAAYTYERHGKRTKKVVSATTTNDAYDANRSLPVVLTDGTLKYVYGLGLSYAVDSGGNTQTYHTDGLGSVRAITDPNDNLNQTFQTDEFGVPALTQGTSTEPFRFTGQQSDSESGFYDLRARYYAPGLGRFVSRDTLFGSVRKPLSLNRYSYAENDPASLVDPAGRQGSYEDELRAFEGEGGLVGGGLAFTSSPEELAAEAKIASAPATEEMGSKAIPDVNEGSYTDLTSPQRRTHILEGDLTGGGHRPGTGISGKSEFPASWSDDRIMHNISDVATDPQSTFTADKGETTIAVGTRDGIEIKVVVDRDGQIITAYPINVPRNP